MTKLNQMVAIEPGVKTVANKRITELYHLIQKVALFGGLSRTYHPDDEEGETLPSETNLVQHNVKDVMDEWAKASIRWYDVTVTKETANMEAKADVVVDKGQPTERVLLSDVPVTAMLFLEKQLTDVSSFVSKLPTLDPAVEWNVSGNTGRWTAQPVRTARTKKTRKAFILHAGTDKHAPQVQAIDEDVKVGEWELIKTSGAIPEIRRAVLLDRCEKLLAAVKFAREEANSIEVTDVKVGDEIFGYLFSVTE